MELNESLTSLIHNSGLRHVTVDVLRYARIAPVNP
jgi:hypothetical protein